MQRRQQGFTLLELMIVVAIMGILAAAVVPNLVASKSTANEAAALATLRTIVTAESQFQVSVAMDNDLDGAGEFGTFGELSGITPLNNRGMGLLSPLDPPILSSSFRSPDPTGVVNQAGYNFIVYLPDAFGAGLAETGGPAAPIADPAVDDDNCEVWWAAYAWPAAAGTTGNRCFFVNHKGELLTTSMNVTRYSGVTAPTWDAAYAVGPGDLGDILANAPGALGNDGNNWTEIR